MRMGIGEYSENPWEVFYANRDGNNGMAAKETVIQGDYEIIATMHGTKKLQNANAALIAAAPELLEACKAFRDAVIADDLIAVIKTLFIAEAAIVKASRGMNDA